ARLDDAKFRKLFAGSPVKRTGRNRFLRNVLIAIGNAPPGDARLKAAARRCLDDGSPLVRAAAVWAYSRLAPPNEFEPERARALSQEPDDLVRQDWVQAEPELSAA
ncbi:MAG: tRNA epoxyqueuosine(34) reductase QueG, partial [Stellaceae bacterium]